VPIHDGRRAPTRDTAPGGNRPWQSSSPCHRSRRGARLSARPRLHRQGGRRAMTSLQMRQRLVRGLPRLGRRCSVPRRICLVDPLRAGCRGPWLLNRRISTLPSLSLSDNPLNVSIPIPILRILAQPLRRSVSIKLSTSHVMFGLRPPKQGKSATTTS